MYQLPWLLLWLLGNQKRQVYSLLVGLAASHHRSLCSQHLAMVYTNPVNVFLWLQNFTSCQDAKCVKCPILLTVCIYYGFKHEPASCLKL